MPLGWIGATVAFASVARKQKTSWAPSTRALSGPRSPRQCVHRPAKAKRGLSSASANQTGVPNGIRAPVFAERRCRHDASVSLSEPWAPVRVLQIPGVRDQLIVERPGHAPARHDELALAVRADADDWGHLVGGYRRQWREIARAIVFDREEILDGLRAFSDAVEFAHSMSL